MSEFEPVLMTEQRKAYADLLDALVKIGLVLLVVTFLPFVTGILPPLAPLETAPELWTLPLAQYLERTGAHPGLWWLTKLRYADYLPLVGIAFLALASIICYARILPIWARARNTPYLLITLLQILVLCLSASGLFAVGAPG